MAGVGAAAPPLTADEEARRSCATAGDTLKRISLKTFDEKTGARGWRATRQEFVDCVTAQGADYAATLLQTGVSVPVDRTTYNLATLNANDATGRPPVTMAQCRQEAMLGLLRTALMRDSESYRLIKDSIHCTGLTVAGGADQALAILDNRWNVSEVDEPSGDMAHRLFNKQWPVEFSEEAYLEHMDKTYSMASTLGMSPRGENADDQSRRSMWWHIFTRPSADSPYYAAATEARNATAQACTTVAHRTAWRAAMLTAIRTQTRAMGTNTQSGVVRGANAAAAVVMPHGGACGAGSEAVQMVDRAMVGAAHLAQQMSRGYSECAPTDTQHQVDVERAMQAAAFAGALADQETRKCVRCALAADGGFRMHPKTFNCKAVCKCKTCKSRMHCEHSCWIKNGVPEGAKLVEGFGTEMRRLHQLFLEGKWNPMTTPTTIKWIAAARRAEQAGGAAAAMNVEAHMAEIEMMQSAGLSIHASVMGEGQGCPPSGVQEDRCTTAPGYDTAGMSSMGVESGGSRLRESPEPSEWDTESTCSRAVQHSAAFETMTASGGDVGTASASRPNWGRPLSLGTTRRGCM